MEAINNLWIQPGNDTKELEYLKKAFPDGIELCVVLFQMFRAYSAIGKEGKAWTRKKSEASCGSFGRNVVMSGLMIYGGRRGRVGNRGPVINTSIGGSTKKENEKEDGYVYRSRRFKYDYKTVHGFSDD